MMKMILAATVAAVLIDAVLPATAAERTTQPDIAKPGNIGKTPEAVPGQKGADNEGKSAAPPMSLPPGGPANSSDIMFEPNVPNWNSGPEREAYEERMKADIESWQEKVADYSNRADESGSVPQRSSARRLERAWQAVEQNWQKVRQADREEHWAKARNEYDSSVAEISRLWAEIEKKGEAGGPSPR